MDWTAKTTSKIGPSNFWICCGNGIALVAAALEIIPLSSSFSLLFSVLSFFSSSNDAEDDDTDERDEVEQHEKEGEEDEGKDDAGWLFCTRMNPYVDEDLQNNNIMKDTTE